MGTFVPVQGGYAQGYQAAPQPQPYQQPQQPVVYQQPQASPFAQSSGYPAQQQYSAPAANYGNQMTNSYGNSYANNYSYAPSSTSYSYAPQTTNNYSGPVVNGPVIVNQNVNVFNNYGTINYGQPAQSVPLAQQPSPFMQPQQQSPFMQPQQSPFMQPQQLTPQQQGAMLTMMGGMLTVMGGMLTFMGSLFGQQQPGAAPPGQPGQPPAGQPVPGQPAPGQPGQPPAGQPPAADQPPAGTPSAATPANANNGNENSQDTVRRAFRTILGEEPNDRQLERYSKRLDNQSLTERQLAEVLLTSNSYKSEHKNGQGQLQINRYAEAAAADMFQFVLGRRPTAQEARDMKQGIIASYNAGRPLRAAIGLQMDFLYATPEYRNRGGQTGNTGSNSQAA